MILTLVDAEIVIMGYPMLSTQHQSLLQPSAITPCSLVGQLVYNRQLSFTTALSAPLAQGGVAITMRGLSSSSAGQWRMGTFGPVCVANRRENCDFESMERHVPVFTAGQHAEKYVVVQIVDVVFSAAAQLQQSNRQGSFMERHSGVMLH